MAKNYKDYVGPGQRYRTISRERFELLLEHGLREPHRLLDIGCGSLRLGRLAIPFLAPKGYHGLEPGEKWLYEGLKHEIEEVFGESLVQYKEPAFDHNEQFTLDGFGVEFDYIVAFSVFIHCGQEQFKTCLTNARAVMKQSESIFLLDLNIAAETSQSGTHSKYPWASNQKTRYAMEDALEILRSHGFDYEVLYERVSERKKKTRTMFKLRLTS